MDAGNILTSAIALLALIVSLINRKGDKNQEDSQWKGKIQQEVESLKSDNSSSKVRATEIITKQAQYGSEIKTLFEKNKEQDEKIYNFSNEIKNDLKSLEGQVESIRSEVKADVQIIVGILKNKDGKE